MKSRLKTCVILSALLFGAMVSSVSAFIPSGWVYMQYPYCYNQSFSEWHYINEADATWVCNTSHGSTWWKLKNATLRSGWSYWNGSWAYSSANSSWYWVPTDNANITWCCNMGSRQWTKLGVPEAHSGDVQFTLTWDRSVDLDLHVQRLGEKKIYFDHKISTSGGRLDVDDRDGYGPENVYWPSGTAPRGGYQPSIHFWSANGYSGTVNLVLKIKRSGYADVTLYYSFVSPRDVGLNKLPPTYYY